MAKETKKPDTTEPVVETVGTPAVQTPEESQYTVGEFAANAARLFGAKANSDLVHAAFLVEGISKATLSEAKKIVAGYMQKEVK